MFFIIPSCFFTCQIGNILKLISFFFHKHIMLSVEVHNCPDMILMLVNKKKIQRTDIPFLPINCIDDTNTVKIV